MVHEFLEAGERLWERSRGLLRVCEGAMWRAAEAEAESEGRRGGEVKMGKRSGEVFAQTMFGRDGELERTERLMQAVRLWGLRFEANCEEVVRDPGA